MHDALIARRVLPCLLLGTLCGCSYDCATNAPVPTERTIRAIAGEYSPLPGTVDIETGHGRLASPSDRMEFRAVVRDEDGSVVSEGPTTPELMRPTLLGRQIAHPAVTSFASYIYGSVNGMREGGVREFAINLPRLRPQLCHLLRGTCQLPIGRGASVAPDQGYTLRLTLQSLCSPLYCVKWELHIPPGGEYNLVERRCGGYPAA